MAPPALSPEAQKKKDAVAAYVKSRGGNLAIRKVLIANNGMAATKSILSMRQWAYMELGDDRAIEFVVMATPEVSEEEGGREGGNGGSEKIGFLSCIRSPYTFMVS